MTKEILVGVIASIATAFILWLTGLLGSFGYEILLPSRSVVAFNLEKCPQGWDEFKPAYGRFVRGVDRSGNSVDPEKERTVSSLQEDEMRSHTHAVNDPGHSHGMGPFSQPGNIFDSGNNRSAWSYYSSPNMLTSSSKSNISIGNSGGADTRPKNVALLYCEKK